MKPPLLIVSDRCFSRARRFYRDAWRGRVQREAFAHPSMEIGRFWERVALRAHRRYLARIT